MVGGAEHVRSFADAGSRWGCTARVLQGVVPNEHGTWQFGRGGWCDGQQVWPMQREGGRVGVCHRFWGRV